MNQQLAHFLNPASRIFSRLGKMAPHRRGPTGIVRFSADHMQVQLRHDVADCGEVYFAVAEMAFNEFSNHCCLIYRGSPLLFGKIEQLSSRGLRHENEPG